MVARSVTPECAAPGCEARVKRNRHNDKAERPFNLYCSRTCYYTVDRKYRDGLCMRGHPLRVTGTRVNSAGKTVDKKQCDLCKRATRFARMYGVDIDVVLDHNHATAEVRGWLCGNCNSGLGQFGDSPELLLKAAQYLMGRGYYGVVQ